MKKILLSLFTVALFSTSFSQVGLGIGTAGVNVKSNPDKALGLIFRQDFGLTRPGFTSELNAKLNVTNKSDIKFYFGVGGAINYGRKNVDAYSYLRMPIGLEYFPGDRFSVAVESGFNYFLVGNNPFTLGSGLFEITYYFGR